MHVHELRDARAEHGGKAANLARLIAAGLPVPAGFVIDAGAFAAVAGLALDDPEAMGHALEAAAHRIETAELPAALTREVADAMRELGPLVVVRSSASIEDGARGAAPGVFESRRAVPVADVWSAIRAVWASALAPLAVAYARHTPIAISVIVQRHVDGELVTVYTRDPSGDGVVVQRGELLTRVAREALPADVANQHAVLQALRAERVLDAPADVELVQSSQQHDDEHVIETWVVQARPIVQRAARAHVPPPPLVLAPLADGRTWTWDVAHNPDPLSPAQQGLVERVEAAQLGAWALRVCAGYLYATPRADAPAPSFDRATFAARARTLEAECARILAAPAAGLADALARYVAFYAVWADQLSPLIAAARAGSRGKHARPSSVEAVLAAAARGEISRDDAIARLGDLAPAWDIAVAPFGERPQLLDAAISLFARIDATTRDRDEPADRGATHDDMHALAADFAERDDLLFARAQRLVRDALRAHATALGIHGDTVFWLPLDEIAAAATIDPVAATRRAAAARAAAHRAAQWQMPFVVGPDAVAPAGEALRGVGSGPRVVGRVVRFASLAAAALVGPHDVIVVRAVTPALAVYASRCTALVSETGGLLDHGAAMARELGITCVVGCRDAWGTLDDGMTVAVDGDAGVVTILDEA